MASVRAFCLILLTTIVLREATWGPRQSLHTIPGKVNSMGFRSHGSPSLLDESNQDSNVI